MKPLEIMSLALDLGVTLKAENKRIKATPSERITDDLREAILQNKEVLTEYLTYDQEAVYELLRAARAYISERYSTSVFLAESLVFDERIALAEAREDMWSLRIAVREWVVTWLEAINKMKMVAGAKAV